jgi:hypothetical protein
MDFEQEQKFAEPNVIHPELKSAIRYQICNIYEIYNDLTFPTACKRRLPDSMDIDSEVAKANVSQRDREKFEARCFKTSRL